MRRRKDSAILNVKVLRPIREALDEYADRTGYTRTVVVEKALRAYLGLPERFGEGSPGETEGGGGA